MTGDLTRDQIDQHLANRIITPRQADILQLRRRGFSQYVIARGLGISRSTVRSLEKTALDKITLRKDAA
jgi:DNA-binding CsgD family transcriptional regulator